MAVSPRIGGVRARGAVPGADNEFRTRVSVFVRTAAQIVRTGGSRRSERRSPILLGRRALRHWALPRSLPPPGAGTCVVVGWRFPPWHPENESFWVPQS